MGAAIGNGPSKVSLFVNKRNLDFNSLESVEPTTQLTPAPAEIEEGRPLPLTGSAFQSVTSLSVRSGSSTKCCFMLPGGVPVLA